MPEVFNDPLAKYYISAALAFFPACRIYMRAGFRPYGALLLAVPFAGFLLAAGLLAFRAWPNAPLVLKKKGEAA